MTYWLYDERENFETGTLTVEDDGRMKHTVLGRTRPPLDSCQDLSPTFAGPR